MSEPIVVPAYSIKPMTRRAMVMERLAKESGHPAAAVLAHIGQCRFRGIMFRACLATMFNTWQIWDFEADQWRDASASYCQEQWEQCSAALLTNFGPDTTCPHCTKPCHPVETARRGF